VGKRERNPRGRVNLQRYIHMKIRKDNIDKLPLNELEDDTRIWEVMLPEIRKHLDGKTSVFDGIQCPRQFEGYTAAGIALVESAVIAPRLKEYWECSDKGAYTFEWTEKDDREFSEYIKARWSYMMWLANEAMNGTLGENLTYKSTLGTTWGKILDEAWGRDFKIMRLLCGDLDESELTREAPTTSKNNPAPELPF
jgi:hypothetical protein